MTNIEIIKKNLDPKFNEAVMQRAAETTNKEKILMVFAPSGYDTLYVITERCVYIFEGTKHCQAVSTRKAEFRNITEFHFYNRNAYDTIAVISKGHVVFVLKSLNLTSTLQLLRIMYQQQVLNDPLYPDKDKVRNDFDNWHTYPAQLVM